MNMGTSELWERMKMFEGTRPRNSSSLQQFNVTLLHFLFGCCLPQRRFRPAYILVYSSFSHSCPFLSPTRMIFIQNTLVPQDECVSLVRQCFLFLLFSVRTVCSIIIWDGINLKTVALDSCMNFIDVIRMIMIRATINVTLAASQQRSDHLFFRLGSVFAQLAQHCTRTTLL
jgi:hypothetical protein